MSARQLLGKWERPEKWASGRVRIQGRFNMGSKTTEGVKQPKLIPSARSGPAVVLASLPSISSTLEKGTARTPLYRKPSEGIHSWKREEAVFFLA